MMPDASPPQPFHNDAGRFRAALAFTASTHGFAEALIEKDYFCSLLLLDLLPLFERGLVFKGGTCLSKVHLDFFRLSEDLDFAVSLPLASSFGNRRRAAEPIKAHLAGLPARLPFFTEAVAFTGHNRSTQYIAHFSYQSLHTGGPEPIKVEVSFREPVLRPAVPLPAKTLLLDPVTNSAALPPFTVAALSPQEAYAEKVRAALSRREPAIRDFFDLDTAILLHRVYPEAADFIDLVRQKLTGSSDRVDTSLQRIAALRRQIEPQLRPVLRSADYDRFDLDRIASLLQGVVSRCNQG